MQQQNKNRSQQIGVFFTIFVVVVLFPSLFDLVWLLSQDDDDDEKDR